MKYLSTVRFATLLGTICFLCFTVVHNQNYNELETLGMACSPADTCNRQAGELPFENRKCECDNSCNNYNDCCIDARSRRNRPRGRPRSSPNFECLSYESDADERGVYVVAKCLTNYQGPEEIRSNCEQVTDISNPLAAAPVMDMASHTTYKNHYCAQCNNAEAENLRSWDIGIDCEILPQEESFVANASYIEEHLIFSNSSQPPSWGFYYPEDQENGGEFYSCNLQFNLSEALSEFVRFCRPNLIASCPRTWRRATVRQKCESYMAVVHTSWNASYRNPHCFVCNDGVAKNKGVNPPCTLPPKAVEERKRRSGLSFAVLMDVNPSDGERVGLLRDTRCPSNQKWDPFAKRCRRLTCAIPGWVIEHGQCVRPS